MGVPGFVAWLRSQCKDIMICDALPKNPETLYIDGNCLIHPKCFEVLTYKGMNKTTNIDKLENIMFNRICKFIDYLVDYVNPTKECYFAVDGVAPVAKINQQRKRRYRSVDDALMKEKLKAKHKMEPDTKWSNTVITPGTTFMEKLHQHFQKYFANKANTSKIKYTYSSYHTPGEGEHKILRDIKKRLNDDGNNIYVIYGLDADLFFLAMASQRKNIYLLREEFNFVHGKVVKREITNIIEDVAEDLKFVSIDITKKCYEEIIGNILMQKTGHELTSDDYWNDFVFICYFLGNDFLPHLPTIDIHKSGLDTIMDGYTDIVIRLNCQLLVVKQGQISINNIFLLELLKYLSDKEDLYFKEILPEHNHKKYKRKCPPTADEYSKELWTIENMRFKVNDPIALGSGNKNEWKFRYYEHYFGISEYQQEHIDLLSYSYLEGLLWVTKYYYHECPSWMWQYAFTHAPFISDIYDYLKNSKLDINKITFSLSKPLQPCVQLLTVLPPSCVDIMPKKYSKIVTDSNSPVIDMFPTKVELDMIGKDMYWMCVPILPYLDIDRILDVVKKIKLSQDDAIKNKECNDFVY